MSRANSLANPNLLETIEKLSRLSLVNSGSISVTGTPVEVKELKSRGSSTPLRNSTNTINVFAATEKKASEPMLAPEYVSARTRSPQELKRELNSSYTFTKGTPKKKNAHVSKRTEEYIQKMNERSMAKKKKINEMQLKKFQSEREAMRGTPEILVTSRKMVEPLHIKPIYDRTPELIKRKTENIDEMKRKLKIKNDEENPSPTFHPDLSKSTKNSNSRSMEKVVEDVYVWNQNKEKNIQKKTIDVFKNEMKEITFHPIIDKKSELLLRRKAREEEVFQEKVEDRLNKLHQAKKEKKGESEKKYQSSFTPEINRKSEKILKNKRRRDSSNLAPNMQRENSQEIPIDPRRDSIRKMSRSFVGQGAESQRIGRLSLSDSKNSPDRIPDLFAHDESRTFQQPLSAEKYSEEKLAELVNELTGGSKKGKKKLSELERKRLQQHINEIEFSEDLKFLLNIVVKRKTELKKK